MNTKKRKHVGQKTATTCNSELILPQKPHLDVSCILYLFHLIIEHNLCNSFYRQTASPNKLQSK